MSILTVHDIQGLSSYNNKVRIPSGHSLKVDGGLELPIYTNTTKPASGSGPGAIIYNSDLSAIEIWDGTQWSGAIDGSSEDRAAPSAKWLYDNGIKTSGKELLWITTSTGGTQQVYCDFDTPDRDGNSGWMLVGSFAQGYRWGGKDQEILTSSDTIGTSPVNKVSSNFGDTTINQFRVTSNSSITSNLGSGAAADFYYQWDTACTWKEVWKPDSGQSGKYYLSNGTNPAVNRCCIRQFNSSYNIKYGYENPNHKFNNITDYGYQNSKTVESLYTTGTIGEGVAPLAGIFDVWTALSAPGYRFEWYYVGRSATYSSRSGGDLDGSLSIPVQGAGTDTTGQDVDNNISAKIGVDDNGNWGGAATDATTNAGNNGAITSTSLWWWIK